MTWQSIVQVIALVVALAVCAPLLGRYIARVLDPTPDGHPPFTFRTSRPPSVTTGGAAGGPGQTWWMTQVMPWKAR